MRTKLAGTIAQELLGCRFSEQSLASSLMRRLECHSGGHKCRKQLQFNVQIVRNKRFARFSMTSKRKSDSAIAEADLIDRRTSCSVLDDRKTALEERPQHGVHSLPRD